MARYLTRIAHGGEHTPRDAKTIAQTIRRVLGSKEAMGNLRVSTNALEFDLFAKDSGELDSFKDSLERGVGKIVDLKLLDQPLVDMREKSEILRQGIELFNQERFWESHEMLERIWHPARGSEKDIIQGIILTAAALVHAQKDRIDTSLNMLRRAKGKLGTSQNYEGISLSLMREGITNMLERREPKPFKIKL